MRFPAACLIPQVGNNLGMGTCKPGGISHRPNPEGWQPVSPQQLQLPHGGNGTTGVHRQVTSGGTPGVPSMRTSSLRKPHAPSGLCEEERPWDPVDLKKGPAGWVRGDCGAEKWEEGALKSHQNAASRAAVEGMTETAMKDDGKRFICFVFNLGLFVCF